MIIMQGLPASGKSTRAAEIIKTDGNAVRLNRDLLRKMLHFGKWTGKNEAMTKDIARAIAERVLLQEKTIIIDDTNLIEGTVHSWKELAKACNAKIQYERMETPMEECIDRDFNRIAEGHDGVGKDVIVQMALQSGLYPKPKKGFVLCDIDGTLANIDHRLHFVQGEKKDWTSFFTNLVYDTPNIEVVDMLINYEDLGYEIIFISARPDTYRAFTEDWIINKVFKGYEIHKTLIMRREGDHRPDTEVKQQMFDTYFKGKYDVSHIIDDRPSVIRMWRSNNLSVIDVGNGVEF